MYRIAHVNRKRTVREKIKDGSDRGNKEGSNIRNKEDSRREKRKDSRREKE